MDIANHLKRWLPSIIAGSDEAVVDNAKASGIIQRLEQWSGALDEMPDGNCFVSHPNISRWRHSSITMLTAIRMACMLKGGSAKLETIVRHAVSLAAPPFISGALSRALAQHGCRGLPSASVEQRCELSLDFALNLLRRSQYDPTAFRFIWSDSSEMGGFDWLWQQCHEISRDDVIPLFKAVVELTTLIGMFSEASVGPVETNVQEHWKPLLRMLLKIKEEIYTPASLESGFKGLVHKVAAMAHQWHMVVPVGVKIIDHADTVVAHCSDMGIEMSAPDFHVSSHEELLPAWVNRETLHMDVEEQVLDDEDVGILSESEAGERTPTGPECKPCGGPFMRIVISCVEAFGLPFDFSCAISNNFPGLWGSSVLGQ